MNRRDFAAHTLGATVAYVLGARSVEAWSPSRSPGTAEIATFRDGDAAFQRRQLRVNGDRLLERLQELSAFGADPGGGINRTAFSEADREARAWLSGWMEEAGLAVRIDAAANLIGTRRGAAAVAALMTGSHIDSVPGGGNYDGPVGALAAIEVAHTLSEAGVRLRHPLEVVIFSNEEGGKTGSRAMSAEILARDLTLPSASGMNIGEGIALLGGDPARIADAARAPGSIAAFLELHIEQGAVLDEAGIDIGVVEGIVGIRRWNVVVEGFTNHAGTTPMNARRDALVAAARWIDATNRVVTDMPGRQVATVGRIHAEPGAPNVIPGRAALSLEIRDLDMERIQRVFELLRAEATAIGDATGTRFGFEEFYVSRAAPTDESLRREIELAATGLGLRSMRMPSGAGHDAQSIALLSPIGMIFVPSVNGISHSPAERTKPDDIIAGANVLLQTLLAVDAGSSVTPGS